MTPQAIPEAPAAIARLVEDEDVLAAALPARLQLEREVIGGGQAVHAGADHEIFDMRGNGHRLVPFGPERPGAAALNDLWPKKVNTMPWVVVGYQSNFQSGRIGMKLVGTIAGRAAATRLLRCPTLAGSQVLNRIRSFRELPLNERLLLRQWGPNPRDIAVEFRPTLLHERDSGASPRRYSRGRSLR